MTCAPNYCVNLWAKRECNLFIASWEQGKRKHSIKSAAYASIIRRRIEKSDAKSHAAVQGNFCSKLNIYLGCIGVFEIVDIVFFAFIAPTQWGFPEKAVRSAGNRGTDKIRQATRSSPCVCPKIISDKRSHRLLQNQSFPRL